ncbi:Hint domain-containing protein [Rhodophyticola sp. CCM32]|uniref:Hint domain-containing protein n=1 Tax=Rhodophyticola sp. CCM32 TaxID=2916397 RepID=UPI00143DA9DD|nr:Hint domain-containing protein [Rhodophyticola sp. CCM32]
MPKSDHVTLILEGRLSRGGPRPVRLWAGIGDASGDFTLYRMPDGAMRISHRDVEMTTEPGTLSPGETFLLHYRADANGRDALIDIQNIDRGLRLLLRPRVPSAPALTDFLPKTPRYMEQLTLAALATHELPVGHAPCFETGTPINTPSGPVRVEDLRPGMVVNTLNNGPQPVRWTGQRELLCLGSMAPVLLRAPYFGLTQDCRVSPRHRILMDGTDVEYLFGEERVYIRAGDLVNGISARRDYTKPTRVFHHFLLDDHDCVTVGRCRMETLLLGDMLAADGRNTGQLSKADALPDYPTLDRAAAQTLLSLIAEHRRVAA